MTCLTRAAARLVFAIAPGSLCTRALPRLSALVIAASSLTACYGGGTADEALLYDPDEEEASDGGVRGNATDGGTNTGKTDGGTASDDDPCAGIDDSDVLGQIFCDFTSSNNQTGSLGVTASQCRNADPNDLITQGLCAAQTLTGGNAANDPISQALDLLGLLGTVGGLTGGTGQTGGIGDLLGLLGGGTQQSGTGGLGDLLGLLGGGTQTTGTNTNADPLGGLLDLLGGLQGNGTAQTQAPR